MFWIALAGLIISVAIGVDQVVGQQMYNDRTSDISQQTTRIMNEIAKDEKTYNNLLDAYNRKDATLMSDILNSSPFGSRFKIIKNAYIKNKENIERSTQDLNDVRQESVKAQNAINEATAKNQTSGSALMDSINGLTNGGVVNYSYQSKT